MAAVHPTPKLSDFYEFFSFSHLSPPILREYPSFGLWGFDFLGGLFGCRELALSFFFLFPSNYLLNVIYVCVKLGCDVVTVNWKRGKFLL
jgi:hypothetical protein